MKISAERNSFIYVKLEYCVILVKLNHGEFFFAMCLTAYAFNRQNKINVGNYEMITTYNLLSGDILRISTKELRDEEFVIYNVFFN
jgi:hypothetical protein